MKPKSELRNGSQHTRPKSMEHSAPPVTLLSAHKYNLRSIGPPRYVQFSDDECPICLEDFSAPVIANCGHSFCTSCIQKCMQNVKPAVCPVCKERLIKNLFLHNMSYSNHPDAVSSIAKYRNSVTTMEKNRNSKLSNLSKKAAN
ncbi:E3 ubiquitin-protein ligase RNF170-like [Anopheles marshallii]|uniref:E3 ubiquitin-protein ligase RNF170-like n=1 Tax=Anopheles marshallii TaxID=1521116 RepID=UPI00237B3650|nr:E3 ubiquitin-protein ligase RNF170-like [Anopheles marshallii]